MYRDKDTEFNTNDLDKFGWIIQHQSSYDAVSSIQALIKKLI